MNTMTLFERRITNSRIFHLLTLLPVLCLWTTAFSDLVAAEAVKVTFRVTGENGKPRVQSQTA